MDQFWSPLTNALDAPYGGSLDNRLRFSFEVLRAMRPRVGADFIVGVRFTADEGSGAGSASRRPRNRPPAERQRPRRFPQRHPRPYRHRRRSDDVIPIQGMPSAPHLDFAGEIRAATDFPTFHAARISDVATARHAMRQASSTWSA